MGARMRPTTTDYHLENTSGLVSSGCTHKKSGEAFRLAANSGITLDF